MCEISDNQVNVNPQGATVSRAPTLHEIEDWLIERKIFRECNLNKLNTGLFERVAAHKTTAKDDNAATGIWRRSDEDEGVLKLAQLRSIYERRAEMRAQWGAFELLAQDLIAAMAENTSRRLQAIQDEAEIREDYIEVFRGESDSIKVTLDFNQALNAFSTDISTPDKTFLYNHLVRDEAGQLYWRYDGGYVARIPMSDRFTGRVISDDDEFWDMWIAENIDALQGYMRAITQLIEFVRLESNEDAETTLYTEFNTKLRESVPSVILKCLRLQLIYIKEGKTKHLHRFKFLLRDCPTLDLSDWKKCLASNLLAGILIRNVPTLPQFSNVAGEGLQYLNIEEIDTLHTPTERPILPQKWLKFLDGKFPSQRMGELRLAKFVKSCMDADDYSRQILVVVGEGNDGKGVCFDSITEMLGRDLAASGLSSGKFSSQFGLQEVINKRLLVVDDISNPAEFMKNDIVKKISGAGAGSVSVDIKFSRPYLWRVSGAKLVMSTNRAFSLLDEASITRCLPLLFRKNYKMSEQIDAKELVASLVSERREFMQWCFDTVKYYQNVTNVKGEKSPLFTAKNLIVITDEQFDEWKAGKLDLSGDDPSDFRTLRKTAFEEDTLLSTRPLPFIQVRQDIGEDDEDYFCQILDTYFNFGPDYSMARSELPQFFVMHTMRDPGETESKRSASLFEMLGFTRSNAKTMAQSPRYRAFVAYMMEKKGVRLVKMHGIYTYKGIALKSQHEVFSAPVMCSSLEDTNAEIPF